MRHVGRIIVPMRVSASRLASCVSVIALVGGCSHVHVRTPTAMAILAPTKGNQVNGRVDFTQTAGGVLIEAKVSGLAPGRHGFHIHERGNCTGDGSGAGPHFDPAGHRHGAPGANIRHAGDLGNLDAGADGTAVYRAEVSGLSLDNGADSIIGRAVVVHEQADDMVSQPAGNAGARQACGLISKNADRWF